MEDKISTTRTGATAVQTSFKEGEPVVGIGNLRVLIVPDGKHWYAQGLEIDYGAQGDSIEDAQRNFERGLFSTIDLNLRINGNIDSLLRFAPSSVLREAKANKDSIKRYWHVSFHAPAEALESALPFSGIDYLAAA